MMIGNLLILVAVPILTTLIFFVLPIKIFERSNRLLSKNIYDREISRLRERLSRYDSDAIESYDADRPESEKLDPYLEDEIQSTLRAIMDKPHRSHIYLRDLIMDISDSNDEATYL